MWYLSERGRAASGENTNTEERVGELGIGDMDRSTEEKGAGIVSGISKGGK